MNIRCKIWWDEKVGAYRIVTPYHPKFVAFIKSQVPASDRAFDPTSKAWTFTEKYFDGIKALCEALWPHEVAAVSRQQAARATSSPVSKTASLDSVIIDFVKLLPLEAAETAYKKAAFVLHPDRGGDMEKMSRLNALWDRVKKEVFNQ